MRLHVGMLLSLLLPTLALGSPASAMPDAGESPATTGQFRVRVLDPGGAPLAGSKVQLIPEPLWGVHLWLETDSAGEAVQPALTPGRYRVLAYWVMEDRFRRYVWRDVELRPGAEEARVELRFERASQPPISGRVRNLDGLPVAGAKVEAYQHFPSMPLDGDLLRNSTAPREALVVTTDAEGRFTLEPLHAGEYGLEIRHEEGLADATASTGGPPVDMVLVPRCPRSASIRVVDERGAPVRSFRVDTQRVRSAKGRFEVERACYLTIEAEGFVPESLQLLGFTSKRVDVPDVVLERGRQLVGRVLGADGKPVRGARLTASWEGATRRPDPASTSASGRFSLGLVPVGREVTLTAQWERRTLRQPLPPGKDGRVTLRFPTEDARLEVRVVDAEGAPLEGIEVTAEGTTGAFSLRTGDAGQATRSVPAGSYEVRVTGTPTHARSPPYAAHRFVSVSAQVPAQGAVELRAAPRGPGRLRVLLPKPSHYESIYVVPGAHDWPNSGQELSRHLASHLAADAQVDVRVQRKMPLIGYTSQNDFSELEPGPYTVFAMNPYDDAPRLLLFRKVVHLQGPERQVVQVRFEGEDTRRLP